MVRTRSGGFRRGEPSASPAVQARRVDRLAEIVDHCTAARLVAEGLGDRFLAYLLAMAIQETRTAMRIEIKTKSAARPAAETQDK